MHPQLFYAPEASGNSRIVISFALVRFCLKVPCRLSNIFGNGGVHKNVRVPCDTSWKYPISFIAKSHASCPLG